MITVQTTEILRSCSRWTDVKRHIDALPTTKQKGDCFEHLVKYYLQLDPKYATKLKSVWLLCEVPTLLRKKLNLPDTDEGIDLVGWTKDGRFWAIQARAFTECTPSRPLNAATSGEHYERLQQGFEILSCLSVV